MASIQQTPNGPVLVLKESALQQKGKDAQKNNITAAKLVAELVKTSLGPRGLDKMLVDSLGDVTITNDGATILKEIDAQHPAAKMMVEVSKTIDTEVGDGTTTSTILAHSILEEGINKIVDGSNPVDNICKSIAKLCLGFSGADLAAICRAAAVRCIGDEEGGKDGITEQHFQDAYMHDVKRSSNDALVRKISRWRPP